MRKKYYYLFPFLILLALGCGKRPDEVTRHRSNLEKMVEDNPLVGYGFDSVRIESLGNGAFRFALTLWLLQAM